MEKFFWADEIADKIIKERGKEKEYACAAGLGLSGRAHIGNFRDVITTDLVVRALKDKGKKVRFIYSWDDYDRFRKVPKGIPKSYEKYIGMPVSDIPSPSGKGKYADYFEKIFEKELESLNIKPEFISQSLMNKKCKYTKLIKIALDKKKEIMDILNKYRKEPLGKNWFPITVYCEKCKKDSTRIINIKGYIIEYECRCGFKNKIDFRKKGIVKLKWRVDWPVRWKYEKLDFEPGGADLGAAGGSMMTSDEIVKKVFDYEPPLHIYYEWIKIKGGKEFSGSKGNVLTVEDVLEIYQPEVLRYLFVGTKPKSAFQISFDNDVIKIYDDYDMLEKKYYEKKANPQEKRIYELSQVKTLSKKKPNRLGFRHLITIVQAGKNNNLNSFSNDRAEKVSNWLKKYASDDFKFEIQKKVRVKLREKEKKALLELKNRLKKKDFIEKELFNEFYCICKKIGISNTDFFDAAYRVIINKKKGPRLTNLILVAGKENIIKLLNQIE